VVVAVVAGNKVVVQVLVVAEQVLVPVRVVDLVVAQVANDAVHHKAAAADLVAEEDKPPVPRWGNLGRSYLFNCN
jgi:DNA replication initiation complex subunit (GINS family)